MTFKSFFGMLKVKVSEFILFVVSVIVAYIIWEELDRFKTSHQITETLLE